MKVLKIIHIVLLLILISSFFYGCTNDYDEGENIEIECPWDEKGAKQPEDYSWEEFEALSGEEQMFFQKSFGNADKFEAWMNNAQTLQTKCPWDEKGAKQPSEYTWEEYEALSGGEQIEFQMSFGEFEDFEAWMYEAQTVEVFYPWDAKGAKQPSEYTWAEFESLSAGEQIAFQKSFENEEEFDKWLTANQP